MFFVGAYDLTIDGKNRLSIPSAVRSSTNCDRDGRAFYVVPGRRRGTLAVYPDRYFERTRRFVPADEQLSEDGHAWREFEYSQSALVDPDAQGRILIPDRLLKSAGVSKVVTLIGVQDHLEIWNRTEFEAFEKQQWQGFSEHRSKALGELAALKREAGVASSGSGPDD
ncbi:MAG: hypothetical protein HRF50_01080 [Phycisphaerae bacterium]|jgi:MraZ protein